MSLWDRVKESKRRFKMLSTTFPEEGRSENGGIFLTEAASRMKLCYECSYEWLVDCRNGNLLGDVSEELKKKLSDKWKDCSEILMEYICNAYGFFYLPKIIYDKEKDEEVEMRLSENLYVIYLLTLCNVAGGYPSDYIRGWTAQRIEYVKKHPILVHPDPISEYDVSKLLDSIVQLDSVWLTLPYDKGDVAVYITLLETRLAEIVMFPQTARVNNVLAYRKDTGLKERVGKHLIPLYATKDLLSRVCPYILNFYRAIDMYLCIDEGSLEDMESYLRDKYGVTREHLDNIIKGIKTRVKDMAASLPVQSSEDCLTTNYQVLSCRASECERYRRLNFKKVSSIHTAVKPDTVIGFCRGVEKSNEIIRRSQLPANVMLNTPEEECTFAAPMAIICMLDKVLVRSNVKFSSYVYYRIFIKNTVERDQDNMVAIRRSDVPLALQTFNFFHLYHAKKQYKCSSFYELVAFWVAIVVHEKNCTLEFQHLGPAMKELLGKQWASMLNYKRLDCAV